MQPAPQTRGVWDDVIRTVIFFFGMAMAACFIFFFPNGGWISLAFAILFLIVSGRNMRTAFFPYGKLVESLFWVGVSAIGFVILLVVWLAGGRDAAPTAVLVGALLGYSLYDTYRSIRMILHVLKAREQAEQELPKEEKDPLE